ncbi:X2-like carbohydrate binding domain-containing protein [Paenibacillus sp. CF384]|uniref:X2-like carbohydrate binding domain-containing protein n=1 Tax=Paenibacillus sp. CF384 TaxID=1884382 RepID=UPI00089AF4F2|nr:X2-like carbohydrate binding domain-containing protein [Paenibacillus sp. CF384]SDX95521.1 S-layer homology domain-containing protein [Paenibacillus sp. CF384]
MKNKSQQRRRKIWLGLLLAIIAIAQIGYVPPHANVAEAADNDLALKPYMGWSSYSMQVYDGPSGNWVSEAKIKQMSDAMHEKLQAHGYNYINIDAGWNGDNDEYGRPIPSTTLYPGGFENLAKYVHDNGQKIGIYMIPGISPSIINSPTRVPVYGTTDCFVNDIAVTPHKVADYWGLGYKVDFSNPCAQKYVESVADQLVKWGVDFVKFDSVTPGSGHNDTSIDARDDVKAWSEALSKRKIWFELSWALDHNYVDFWKKYANGWRVDWDVESYDREVGMTTWANIARLFPDAALWWRDAGPGGWNDFDSLNIGNGLTSGLTKDERQTAMTLWASSSAQLYTGDDLSNLDDYGLELLTNDEVIAVNQAGRPAHPVSMSTKQQVWYANNGDGTYTVALYNLGNKASSVNVNWKDIGLTGAASVRDLWAHKDLGQFATGFSSGTLEPHASRLLKVTAQAGTSLVNDDDTGMRYTGTWTRNGGKELVGDVEDLSIAVTDSSPAPTPNVTQIAENGDNSQLSRQDLGIAAVSHTVMLNDNDPAISYSNRWGYSNNRNGLSDYMNDVHYGEPDNGKEPEFTYTFNGTGIELWSEKGGSNGKLDVYVDNDAAVTVNTEGTPQAGQYAVFSKTDLAPGAHTIRVVRNGTGQYYFILDALKVTTDSLLGQPSASSFSKDVPADITVHLPYGASSMTGIKNGAATLAANTDYSITGSDVTIKQSYLMQQPSGQSTVLDFGFAGGDTQSISIAVTGTSLSTLSATFDLKTSAQANVTTILTLGDGNSLTAIKNGEASLTEGTDYTIENGLVTINKTYLQQQPVGVANITFKFSVSSPQTLVINVINSASPERYAMINDDNPNISYTGSWNSSSGRPFDDYNKDVHYLETNGGFFTYTFNGTGISYITEVDKGQGDVDMYLDGVFDKTVSTYEANASNKPQQAVYTVSGLKPGIHTLKAVKKSGQFMLLDALKVRLTDMIDVSLAEFDKNVSAQADVSVNVLGSIGTLKEISNGAYTLVNGTDYSIAGNKVTINKAYLAAQPVGTTKLTFTFIGDNVNDVHATAANGDYFQYSFKGTGVELLSPTGPEQGDMDIYMDGELKETVNANAVTRDAMVSLFSISSLSDGVHTLKVVKKTGALMLVDALKFNVSANSDPAGPINIGGGGGYTDPGAIKVVHTTLPDGTVKDEVKLSGDIAKALIDKSKAAGDKFVTVSVPVSKNEVSLTSITLPKETVSQLRESGLDVKLEANGVTVQIPNASLKDFKDDAYFNLVPVKAADKGKELEKRASSAKVVIAAAGGSEVTLLGHPVEIETNLQNREVMLVLPIEDATISEAQLKRLGVYIEHSDGTTEFKPGTLTTINGVRSIQFTTNKFSTFALMKIAGDSSIFAHASYVKGYDGGLFKPNGSITRAELATILSRVSTQSETGSSHTYADVKSGYWAEGAIAQVTRMGLMHGYADGSFKPEQAVTRAELAAITASFAPKGQAAGAGYSDTAGHWADSSIKIAQSAGYLKGYADGTFHPGSTLTRAEAVTIMNRVLGRGPLYGIAHSPWKDVPDTHWAAGDIEEASIKHQYQPRTGGGEQAAE